MHLRRASTRSMKVSFCLVPRRPSSIGARCAWCMGVTLPHPTPPGSNEDHTVDHTKCKNLLNCLQYTTKYKLRTEIVIMILTTVYSQHLEESLKLFSHDLTCHNLNSLDHKAASLLVGGMNPSIYPHLFCNLSLTLV